MAIYLMITFSLSEYQSNLSLLINARHERYPFFRAVQPRPLCEEGVELGTEVCPELETWLLTAIKCVLNGASSVSQQVHLENGIESKFVFFWGLIMMISDDLSSIYLIGWLI
jgi:hypothetical protein